MNSSIVGFRCSSGKLNERFTGVPGSWFHDVNIFHTKCHCYLAHQIERRWFWRCRYRLWLSWRSPFSYLCHHARSRPRRDYLCKNMVRLHAMVIKIESSKRSQSGKLPRMSGESEFFRGCRSLLQLRSHRWPAPDSCQMHSCKAVPFSNVVIDVCCSSTK